MTDEILKIIHAIIIFISITFSPTLLSQIPSSEREALIDFYNDLGGDDWIDNTGWLGAVGTECDWYGITCINNHVSNMLFERNNLTGTPTSSLKNLIRLQKLELGGVFEFELIPDVIYEMVSLEVLSIGGKGAGKGKISN